MRYRASVVWKIDRQLIPLFSITYGLTYLDKSALSYAALFGLLQDLDLRQAQYAWVGSIFYVGYLLAEFPSSFAMQRVSTSKYIAFNVVFWGLIMLLHAIVTSFGQLLQLRFWLGVFEACVAPGIVFLMSRWYSADQIPLRLSIIFCVSGVASTLGGFLAYFIGSNVQEASWRLMFGVLGTITVLWGGFLVRFLPNDPNSCSFLGQKERIGIPPCQGSETKFTRSQLSETLMDAKIWLLVLIGFASNIPNGIITTFGTLILQGFESNPSQTALYNTPFGMLQSVLFLCFGYVSSRPNSRLWSGIGFLSVASIATTMLLLLPRTVDFEGRLHGRGPLLAAYYGLVFYSPTGIVAMSMIASNFVGQTKKLVANVSYFTAYSLGNIIGPLLVGEKPTYYLGNTIMLICFATQILAMLSLRSIMNRQNSIRDSQLDDERGTLLSDEDDRQGRQQITMPKKATDPTDCEDITFRYAL